MARVKRGVTAHAKHKKTLDAAKGFYGRRKNTIRIARQAGRWAITMRRHSYVPASRLFQAGPEVPLST